MVETYNGKSPRNARIKIDYTGECPSVQFKYPRKDGYTGSLSNLFMYFWGILNLLFVIFLEGTPGMLLIKDSLIKFYFEIGLEATQHGLMNILLATFFIVIPGVLIWGFIKNKVNSYYPIYQAWLAKKKYVEFKVKDIKISNINGGEEIYIEIPYFENVVLSYEATKDFSKYLDVMEIREHNFKIEERYKDKKVKKQNEWYWNAKFYFNKVPKNGKLNVVFK